MLPSRRQEEPLATGVEEEIFDHRTRTNPLMLQVGIDFASCNISAPSGSRGALARGVFKKCSAMVQQTAKLAAPEPKYI